MTDDTENPDRDAQTGEEIRDEVQADLDSVKVAAISYVYEDDDGEMAASTARFCLHDDDEGEAELMDHLKVDIGLQRLQEDSLLGALGGSMGGGPGGPQVLAMSAEEAEEAGILGSLEEMMEAEAQSDGDSDDDSEANKGFQ